MNIKNKLKIIDTADVKTANACDVTANTSVVNACAHICMLEIIIKPIIIISMHTHVRLFKFIISAHVYMFLNLLVIISAHVYICFIQFFVENIIQIIKF